MSEITVPTLRDVLNLVLPEVPEGQRVSVNVLGFYAQGDIGAKQIWWNPAADKVAHDGGTIIAPDAIAAWDGTSADIITLLSWSGTGLGCWETFDKTYYIEDFGASNVHNYNEDPINHISQLPTKKPLKTRSPGNYLTYHFSAPINFNNRSFDLESITLRPISSFNAPPGTILIRTGTTQVSIRDSFHHRIKIDGNAGSIPGGVSNAANQANQFVAFNIYGDRTPKSSYYIDISNCSKGILVDGDCECTHFEVHSSYVDCLIDERLADESYWEVYGKYSSQIFKTAGQTSGYLFLMWEQTVVLPASPTMPCLEIGTGKAYSIGGELRGINNSILINDSLYSPGGTGHVYYDNLQVIQARTNLAMMIKNADGVSGSFYLENYTNDGVVLGDVKCAAGLTMNLFDCRGGVPLRIADVGTGSKFTGRVNVNIAKSTGGTPSTTAIQIESCSNATVVVGQCFGDIVVGAGVSQVQLELDSSFIYNNCKIVKDPAAGYVGARISGIVPLDYVETRVKPWAFSGVQLENVYRDKSYSSPMHYNETGFVFGVPLVSTTTQLQAQKDLYRINELFKVFGQGVWLLDLAKRAYPSTIPVTPTTTWVDESGNTLVPAIDATDLRYRCVFIRNASYSLADDVFSITRLDGATYDQLVYTVPNGTYRVAIQHVGGGGLVIRDNTLIRAQINPTTDNCYDVLITTGQLRIQPLTQTMTASIKVRLIQLI